MNWRIYLTPRNTTISRMCRPLSVMSRKTCSVAQVEPSSIFAVTSLSVWDGMYWIIPIFLHTQLLRSFSTHCWGVYPEVWCRHVCIGLHYKDELAVQMVANIAVHSKKLICLFQQKVCCLFLSKIIQLNKIHIMNSRHIDSTRLKGYHVEYEIERHKSKKKIVLHINASIRKTYSNTLNLHHARTIE